MALSFSLHFLILYVDFLNVSISYFFGEIKLISLFTQKSFIFLTYKWEKKQFLLIHKLE